MATDPFDTLGLPTEFGLDAGRLQRAYLSRSATLHPDLAAGDPDAARAMATLNEAKRILEDPERRADALLLRLGGPARDQERGLPDGFLMEIMETRQQIEEALASGDPAQRARWEAWARERRQAHIERTARLFADLADPPAPEALRAIRVELNAWRYIERLIEQLDPAYTPERDIP